MAPAPTSSPTGDPPPSLPIIDISPFLTPDSTPKSRHATATALSHACQHTGFFYLTNHGIPPSLITHLLHLTRTLFLSSPETSGTGTTDTTVGKASIARQNPGQGLGDGARGYQRIGENVTNGRRDWHEAVDIYSEARSAPSPPYGLLRGWNRWPSQPSQPSQPAGELGELRGAVEGYVARMRGVGTAVVRAMGVALGLGDSEVFVRCTRESFWVMRLIGYPGLPEREGEGREEGEGDERFSCGAHTDYGLVTLLAADESKGALQVRAKDGSWIVADPVPGALVVNIGDMMECWTNGLWKSTLHRVIHRGEQYRVSIPFFFEPDWDAVVKPLDECVAQTGGKPLYDEVVYGEHLTRKVEGNFY